jgi:hypothetical protein
MNPIKIDGKEYKVTENLPFHGVGYLSKMVEDENGNEQMAVKENGRWRLWTVEDRLGIPRHG